LAIFSEAIRIDPHKPGRYVLVVEGKFGQSHPVKLQKKPGDPARLGYVAEASRQHSPHCVGCPWLEIPYAEQLTRKRDIVGRALAAYPSLARTQVPAVAASPHRLGYRARVKLVVRRSGREIATGLYVPGTHRVIDISSCPVHARPINQVTQYLKKKIVELGIAPYDERNDSGQLRYLDFHYSFARRELSVTLVTRHRDFPQGVALARSLSRKFRFVAGVIHNINEQRGNVIWGDDYRLLSGRDGVVEQIGSVKLAFPSGTFSQANPGAAEKIYGTVAKMASLSGQEGILDLYCGVGPISISLARFARRILGIDENARSIDAAKGNARRNGVANCQFVAGDVAQKVSQAESRLGRIDCITLNPPRTGIQPAAMEAMLRLRASEIIYVSCAPPTLSRDLDTLAHQGYRMVRLQPFDMFPHTSQVETVVLMQKR
jgi:23S rRNA (uracil1939-C5)-methyltransferase